MEGYTCHLENQLQEAIELWNSATTSIYDQAEAEVRDAIAKANEAHAEEVLMLRLALSDKQIEYEKNAMLQEEVIYTILSFLLGFLYTD